MITDRQIHESLPAELLRRNPSGSTKEYRASASGLDQSLALSVIVPTRNEAQNVSLLLTNIQKAFGETAIEVIFVDDSTDNTPQVVTENIKVFPTLNVRVIHRLPQERIGGLGGAVVIGLQAARSEYACVMDGDLQHPPELLPVLLETAINQQADLVAATRRNADSQVSGLNAARNLISKGLDLIARIFFPAQLKSVSDPLTGFFLVRVKAINLEALRPRGFKILIEILIRNPQLRKAEVPFHFGQRFAGESKASVSEAWKYLSLLWVMRFGEDSLRFAAFALVGASGILVNALFLFLVTDLMHIYFMASAGIATIASTLWNFGLTEAWVYNAKGTSEGRLKRLSLFFVMNLAALALRAPLIYAMTTGLGVYHIISNLVSLMALTVLRFALADQIIWGRPAEAEAKSLAKFNIGDAQ